MARVTGCPSYQRWAWFLLHAATKSSATKTLALHPTPKSGWDASPTKVFAKIVIGFPYSSLVAIYTPGFSNGPTAEN